MEKAPQYPTLRWLVLLSAIFGYISLQMTNLSIAPILPQIAVDLNVDIGAATNFMAAFLLSGCLMMLLVGGLVCDRFGVMTALLLGLFFTAAPATLTPWFASTYTGMLVLRILSGFSSGFLFPAMGAIVALWFPPREKGLASGLMGAAVSVGSAFGVIAGPALSAATGSWRQMSALLSLVGWLGFAFALALLIVRRPKPPESGGDIRQESAPTDFKRAFFAPVTGIGIMVTFMAAWGMHCLYGIVPTFLSAAQPIGAGYGPVNAGKLMAGVMAAGVIGPVIGGILMDKVFKGAIGPTMMIGFGLVSVSVYLLGLPFIYSRISILLPTLVLAGLGINMVYPAIFVFIAKTYRVSIVGKMTGLWTGLGTFGGVLGMFLAGMTVKNFGNYNLSLILISAASLAGLLLTILLEHKKRLRLS